MILKTFAPRLALAPFVRAFEIVESEAAVTRTVLPDIGIVLGFRYSGFAIQLNDTRYRPLPNAAVVGLRGSAREMHTSANGGIVLAKFRSAGAASFFRQPLHHLFGLTRPLGEVFGENDVVSTSNRIVDAQTDAERVAIVEQFLLARHRPSDPDLVVSGALRAIGTAAGAIRVSAIARHLQVSQGTLERRFRRIVGASPKHFASIVRLRHAVDLSRQRASLTALALDAGYYDQSHFIRDFRAITGDAPGHFLESATYC